MRSRTGFTLIELMVVVLIVAILAAVMIPIIRGRIDSAKWTEGKAIMGSIATSIRAYAAEHGVNGDLPNSFRTVSTGLGFAIGDLDGTYFTEESFSFTVIALQPIDFTVTCDASASLAPDAPLTPAVVQLDEEGVWTTP